MAGSISIFGSEQAKTPPPAGPQAVDPEAPPLTAELLGIRRPGQSPRPPERQAQPKPDTGDPKAETGEDDDPRRPFRAELDVCELDDRGRPGVSCSARASHISRSELCFISRRMCYSGRTMLALIHLIDSNPAPLCGVVESCEYDTDGRYRVTLRLRKIPENQNLREWIQSRRPRS